MLTQLSRISTVLRRQCFKRLASSNIGALAKEHRMIVQSLQKIVDTNERFSCFRCELEDFNANIDDMEEMAEGYEGDEESLSICSQELTHSLSMIREMEKNMSLLNASDNESTSLIVDFHSGSGGEDACDWTRMLMDMYSGFAKKMEWKCSILSSTYEGNCLHRGTIQISGDNACSYLATESGVHRLVRLSPFDKSNRRHTSFAAVNVTPLLPPTARISVQMKDVQVDRYRSSGPGGQHVNKTESAVRLTHLPTGLVVECQAERSQHQNMELGLALLQAKIDRLQQIKREDEKRLVYEHMDANSWSSQIRSYVLHPYSMVKDHQYDVVSNNAKAVLEGNLQSFIEEILIRKFYKDNRASRVWFVCNYGMRVPKI